MSVKEAIEIIKQFDETYETTIMDPGDIEKLLEAAKELVTALEYTEWLLLKKSMQHQI